MTDMNERHKTYDADALHFIACELTHDINNLDDGENRVRWNNRAMVLALNTITVKEGELATAQRYVSDANEEINRLRAEVAELNLQVDCEIRHTSELLADNERLEKENAALRELAERLPKTKDGVPVIADGMTLYCPRGHEHKLTPADTRVYCLQGECWHKGCQGDSGSGTFWQYEQCTAILNGGAK